MRCSTVRTAFSERPLPMHLKLFAPSLLVLSLLTTSTMALAESTSKEQLLQPPPAAQHYTISSTAGKHGDIWRWQTDDGKLAYRMSMSLRGWITETDQTTTLGADGRPVTISVRGYTDSGDATEDFSVDANGTARWRTAVDEGSAPLLNKRYSAYGGPYLASDIEIDALVKAGDKGIDLLPAGRASISIGKATEIEGPDGKEAVKLAYITGAGFSPSPVWLDKDNRYFGNAGVISLGPQSGPLPCLSTPNTNYAAFLASKDPEWNKCL